jgi:hypothetical protein
MRRGGQTAETLGLEEFLLRPRCQRGCLRSNRLIRLGGIGGCQGSTAYCERFLQGSPWIPWHSAEIDWHFSAYGIALAIRAHLIGIARGTFGVRAGGQEMCLFMQAHLMVALTQGLERTPGRGVELLRCARRQGGLPSRGRRWCVSRLCRSLCRLLLPSRREVHSVWGHGAPAWLPWRGERRGSAPCMKEPRAYRGSCYR